MQPLPTSQTASTFTTAANAFHDAARHASTPATAAKELEAGARATFAGIPSLRMTTSRDSTSQLIGQLHDAADAALVMAKQVSAGDTSALRSDVIDGWVQLTLNAAGIAANDSVPVGW